MRTAEGTEALVALEDAAPDVLFAVEKTTGVPIWSLLRWPVGRATQQIELRTHAVRTTTSRSSLVRRVIRDLAPNARSSRWAPRDRDVLFVVDGGTLAQQPRGRRNWLIEDFAEQVAARALVVQDSALPVGQRALQRPTFQPSVTFADALTRVEIATYLSRPSDAEIRYHRDVIRESFRLLEFDVDERTIAAVESDVLYRLKRLPAVTAEYERLLDRLSPRVVVMQSASYGNRSSLIGLLHDRGVDVIEPQHGWIGPYHVAYNFGRAMWDPRLARTLPDTLLTFGEYWSSIVRHPARLIAVGKAHLERTAALTRKGVEKCDQILVLSSVYERDTLTKFTLRLRDRLPDGWTVLFRPHPSERPTVRELYPALANADRVTLDLRSDVTESLAESRSVFGFASTVLYEALAFDCEPFVIDSPLADLSTDPAIFGPRISDTADLERALRASTSGIGLGVSPAVLESIWKPHAAETFAHLIDEKFRPSRPTP